jgi:hypothetical protein
MSQKDDTDPYDQNWVVPGVHHYPKAWDRICQGALWGPLASASPGIIITMQVPGVYLKTNQDLWKQGENFHIEETYPNSLLGKKARSLVLKQFK